ncbi:TRAP transporter large permease [Oceanicella sp. SM1341]|uniref:TRAP transporter large permease n=1 Tax=Oceanicella sp. SM1341 TaxID=1548889 RepID=UPI000E52BD7C|nr:TRAP transporter large permease [Oceanicella sp. SM1341]
MTESLVGFAILLALIFARVPIAFAMSAVGVAGFGYMRGWDPAFSMLGRTVFETALNYSLSVIPLFIFMGNVLARSGFAQGLYAAAYRLIGRLPGGLAVAAVLSCGGFSAVSGSSLATAATMSKVAMPSMRRFGYDDGLATGAIAAGGTLGILIPPSVILILYGILTESDIGKLFIAGMIPGLLGIALYVAAVFVTVLIKPSLAPKATGAPIALTGADLMGVLAVVVLFAVIMVGIYGGFFTPIEAAGIGAGVSLVIGFAMRRLTWAALRAAFIETAGASAMIFAVIIGAEVFSNFVNFAGLPDALSDYIYDTGYSAWTVMVVILVIYLLLGCVLESLSMILLTVPVFYPLLYTMDFGDSVLADPNLSVIWFGIVVVVATEISLITPPVGMNVFVLKGVLKEVPLTTIFRGVLPFWVADIVRILLITFLPVISLWLIM